MKLRRALQHGTRGFRKSQPRKRECGSAVYKQGKHHLVENHRPCLSPQKTERGHELPNSQFLTFC